MTFWPIIRSCSGYQGVIINLLSPLTGDTILYLWRNAPLNYLWILPSSKHRADAPYVYTVSVWAKIHWLVPLEKVASSMAFSVVHIRLLMVSHYSTDLQGAVMCQDMQQCANRDGEEKDCKPVNTDVTNAGFKTRLCKIRKEHNFFSKKLHRATFSDPYSKRFCV